MFSNITFQTEDLKWLVPMVIGSLALLGCVVALIWNRGWSIAVVGALAVALIGASVFSKISLTKEGVIVETAQLSANILAGLQTAAKTNSDSISKLNTRLDQLTDEVKKVAESQPAAAGHAERLGQIKSDTQQVQSAVKANDDLLKDVGRNNDLLKIQLNQLRF